MEIEFISRPGASPGEEIFVVGLGEGRFEQMRIHDYDRVFAIPGLYEEVVQVRLECASPEVVADRLVEEVRRAGEPVDALSVLDIGAGNGLVGGTLRSHGVAGPIVGLDSEPEAARATHRDRPGVYADYLTATVDQLDVDDVVARFGLTCLTGAGAIGGGHITRNQIAEAWRSFPEGAWLAITFHEFVMSENEDELRDFVQGLRSGREGTEVLHFERFRHRLRMTGEPVYFYVLIARKSAA